MQARCNLIRISRYVCLIFSPSTAVHHAFCMSSDDASSDDNDAYLDFLKNIQLQLFYMLVLSINIPLPYNSTFLIAVCDVIKLMIVYIL